MLLTFFQLSAPPIASICFAIISSADCAHDANVSMDAANSNEKNFSFFMWCVFLCNLGGHSRIPVKSVSNRCNFYMSGEWLRQSELFFGVY